MARGGAALFGGGSGPAAQPVCDPEVELAPSGFLPPPDIPLYARNPPSREGIGSGEERDAILSEVAQAEADRMMVRIERESAMSPSSSAAAAAAGGDEGFVSYDAEEEAQRVREAYTDAKAARRRRARALRAAAEAASESDSADAAAKRAQAAAAEMHSGVESLPDREKQRLEGVKSRLERGRERAEDAAMALKTAEDASAAAEAQRADAVAVAR